VVQEELTLQMAHLLVAQVVVQELVTSQLVQMAKRDKGIVADLLQELEPMEDMVQEVAVPEVRVEVQLIMEQSPPVQVQVALEFNLP
jgi:hypothetical protein